MKKENQASGYLVAAIIVTLMIAFTLVCMLTGNIFPIVRVTGMLFPVWVSAFLVLWCSVL